MIDSPRAAHFELTVAQDELAAVCRAMAKGRGNEDDVKDLAAYALTHVENAIKMLNES